MAENFDVRITDQVSPGIVNKLSAIAEKAIGAYEALERLQKQLSTLGATDRLAQVSIAETQLSVSIDKVTNSAARQKTAIDKAADSQQKLIEKARAAQQALSAQAEINSLLGVNQPVNNSAKASAATFREDAAAKSLAAAASERLAKQEENLALKQQKVIDKLREETQAMQAQASINQLLGVDRPINNSARASASVFLEDAKAKSLASKEADKLALKNEKLAESEIKAAKAANELQQALASQSNFNRLLGVDRPVANSARASASVFLDDEKQKRAAAQATQELENRTNRLLNTIEPTRVAQAGFNRSMAEASDLLRRGAITQDQFNRAAQLATVALDRETAAMARNGRATGFTRNQLLTFQYTANDVVASLASGLPVSTIFFQQIGQVTQSFNGIEGTFKGLIENLGLVRLGLIGATIAAVGMTATFAVGQSEISKFNNILNLTQNSSGLTAKSYEDTTLRLAKANDVSIHSSQTLANELIKTGQFQAQQIEEIVFSTQRLSKLTGDSADDILKAFIRAADGPDKYAEELAKLNIITPSVLEHIRHLVEMGDKTKALEILSKSAYDYLGSVAPQQLNFLVRGWNILGNSISNAFTNLKNFLNENVGDKATSVAASAIESKIAELKESQGKTPDFFSGLKKAQQDQISALEKELQGIRGTEKATLDKAKAESELARNRRDSAEAEEFGKRQFGSMIKGADQAKEKIGKLDETIKRLEKTNPDSPFLKKLKDNYSQIVAEINKKENPPGPKTPKGPKHMTKKIGKR